MMRLHSLSVALGCALGVASLLPSSTAEAGRGGGHGGGHVSVHVGGGVHVNAGIHVVPGARPGVTVRVGGPLVRPWGWGRGHRFGGTVWYGGYWWPRPYYYYYPEYVPSYYGSYYYPVQPMAAPGVVGVAPRREPLPRLGLGVFAGGSNVDGKQDSTDLGLLARLRLTDGLLLEGQFGKMTFPNNERVDRRIGGSLIWELGARNALAPYVLAGAGVEQANVDGSFSTTQEFGELGVGLRLALSRNLHITADIRAGARKAIDSNQPDTLTLARSVAPPTGMNGTTATEDYTRAQLAAIINF